MGSVDREDYLVHIGRCGLSSFVVCPFFFLTCPLLPLSFVPKSSGLIGLRLVGLAGTFEP